MPKSIVAISPIKLERSSIEEQLFCQQYEQDVYHLLAVVEKRGNSRRSFRKNRSLSDSLRWGIPKKKEDTTHPISHEMEWLIDGNSLFTIERELTAYSNLKWWQWQKFKKWLTIDIKHQREMVFYLKSLKLLIGLANHEPLEEMVKLYEELKHLETVFGKNPFWKRIENQVSALMYSSYFVVEVPYERYLRNSPKRQLELEWRFKFYQDQTKNLGEQRLHWYVFWKKPISDRINIQDQKIDEKFVEGQNGIRAQVEKYRSRYRYSPIRLWQSVFTSLPSQSALLAYYDTKVFTEMIAKPHDTNDVKAIASQNTHINEHVNVRREMPGILRNVLEFYGSHAEALTRKIENQLKSREETKSEELSTENPKPERILLTQKSEQFRKKLKKWLETFWYQKINSRPTVAVAQLKKREGKLFASTHKQRSVKRSTVQLNSVGAPQIRQMRVQETDLQSYQSTVKGIHDAWLVGLDFLSQKQLEPVFQLVKKYQAQVEQLIHLFDRHKPNDVFTQNHLVRLIQAWILETYKKLREKFQEKVEGLNVPENNSVFDELLYETYYCQNLAALSQVSIQPNKIVEIFEPIEFQSNGIFAGDYEKTFDFFNTAYPHFLDIMIDGETARKILLSYLDAYQAELKKIKDNQLSGYKKESEIKQRYSKVIELLQTLYDTTISKLSSVPEVAKRDFLLELLNVLHSSAVARLQKQQELDGQVLSGNFEGITQFDLPSQDISPEEWFLNADAATKSYKVVVSKVMLVLVEVFDRYKPKHHQGTCDELDSWFNTVMDIEEIQEVKSRLTTWRHALIRMYHTDKGPELMINSMNGNIFESLYKTTISDLLKNELATHLQHNSFWITKHTGFIRGIASESSSKEHLNKIDRLMYEILMDEPSSGNDLREIFNEYDRDLKLAEKGFDESLSKYKALKPTVEREVCSKEPGKLQQESTTSGVETTYSREQKDTFKNPDGSISQASVWNSAKPAIEENRLKDDAKPDAELPLTKEELKELGLD